MSILSLNKYNHLFDKCKLELDELMSCSQHPQYDYLIFNLVFGLNHLFEWYIKDDEVETELKSQCIRQFNPYQCYNTVSAQLKSYYSDADFPPTNRFQETIRKLCNNAKHFNTTAIEKQDKNYTCLAAADGMHAGELLAQAAQFDHYNYSVEIDGEDIDLVMLIEKHLSKWASFFEHGV